MSITKQDITIAGRDGPFSAYCAMPSDPVGPAIIIEQEIFGVNTFIRRVADDMAHLGYIALCPDLFWRIEPGIQLDPSQPDQLQRGFGLFGQFDVDHGIRDIQDTITHARNIEACNGKVGAIGYCLGGKLAYLTMCRTDADAAVGYYGVGIAGLLDEVVSLTRPLLLHIAGDDEFVSADDQQTMHTGLDDHALVTLHDYPGRSHGFSRIGGDHYHEGAASQANSRTAAFLAEHLG